MRTLTGPCMLFAAIIVSPVLAYAQAKETKKVEPVKTDARLIVADSAGLFSPDGIKKAKAALSEVRSAASREMHIVTFKELPESRKKTFEEIKDPGPRDAFYVNWAKEEAKGARGVFVLICMNPARIQVLADKEVRSKGFTVQDDERVRDLLIERFRETRKIEKEQEKMALRDRGLLAAVEFVRDAYKKMTK